MFVLCVLSFATKWARINIKCWLMNSDMIRENATWEKYQGPPQIAFGAPASKYVARGFIGKGL